MTNASPDSTDALAALAARAESGEINHLDLINAFLEATVFVPSVADPAEGTIEPVLTKVDDTEFMVVASTEDALEATREVAMFGVPMPGRSVIQGMNPELSLMINIEGGAFAMPKTMLDDIRSTSNPLA